MFACRHAPDGKRSRVPSGSFTRSAKFLQGGTGVLVELITSLEEYSCQIHVKKSVLFATQKFVQLGASSMNCRSLDPDTWSP